VKTFLKPLLLISFVAASACDRREEPENAPTPQPTNATPSVPTDPEQPTAPVEESQPADKKTPADPESGT
jgi:hypothetical protein